MTARRGDHPAALAGLRLRRLISFLKRHRLYRTAHALERETGFFDAEHLRRMMLHELWAAASSYALSFVNVRDCSREADVLNYRIIILRVLAALAAGHGRFVDGLFRRIYSYVHVFKDCDGIRRLLLSMRSDNTSHPFYISASSQRQWRILWTWLPSAQSSKQRNGYHAAPSILPTSCRSILGCGNIPHATRIEVGVSRHISLPFPSREKA